MGASMGKQSRLASRIGRIAVIGAGNMGQAIIAGLLGIDGIEPSAVSVANPSLEKRQYVAQTYGVATFEDNVDTLPADTVFLAVKPAKACEVASQLAAAGLGDALVVSVAAGVSTAKLAAALGGCARVVRVMPNTPLTIGAGMSGVSGGTHASEADVELVREVFASMGGAVVVDEGKQDIVTAISGSGPAYFELFVQSMAKAGESLGLAYEDSLELALKTMLGTAKMIDETHQDLDAAIKAVSSPGGTTVAALDAMRAGNIETTIAAGVAAAARRSKELGA